MPAKKKEETTKPKSIMVSRPKTLFYEILIRGLSDLVVNRFWNTKPIILKETGQPPLPKVARDLDYEYNMAFHIIDPFLPEATVGKYGFPCSGFKGACVKIAAQALNDKMFGAAQIRRAFHVIGDLALLDFDEIIYLEEYPVAKPAGRVLSPRPSFYNWSTKLYIRFTEGYITPARVSNILDHAGSNIGVGVLRPDKGGNNGMFEVAGMKTIRPTDVVTHRFTAEERERRRVSAIRPGSFKISE